MSETFPAYELSHGLQNLLFIQLTTANYYVVHTFIFRDKFQHRGSEWTFFLSIISQW